jgi:hypothetical protein
MFFNLHLSSPLFSSIVNFQGKFNAYYKASNMILHGQPVSLNPDHTHFIFVDDGFRNRYSGVAEFRARFEKKLCTPKQGRHNLLMAIPSS